MSEKELIIQYDGKEKKKGGKGGGSEKMKEASDNKRARRLTLKC